MTGKIRRRQKDIGEDAEEDEDEADATKRFVDNKRHTEGGKTMKHTIGIAGGDKRQTGIATVQQSDIQNSNTAKK
jgi:hypothetical protein